MKFGILAWWRKIQIQALESQLLKGHSEEVKSHLDKLKIPYEGRNNFGRIGLLKKKWNI